MLSLLATPVIAASAVHNVKDYSEFTQSAKQSQEIFTVKLSRFTMLTLPRVTW